MWCEVLVLMGRCFLLEGSVSKDLCPGWEGSATILPACLRVLEEFRSWRGGRSRPITSAPQSALVLGGGRQQRTRCWWRPLHHCCLWQVGLLLIWCWCPGMWWCPGNGKTRQARLRSSWRVLYRVHQTVNEQEMKTYFMLSRLYKPVNLNLQTNLHVLFFRYLKVEFRVLVQTTDLLLHPPPKNKTNLQGKENALLVCVFLGCSAALCVSGRRRRRVGSAHRLSHPDSHWDAAAESNVFPPRECRACQTRCFLCQKKPQTLLIL